MVKGFSRRGGARVTAAILLACFVPAAPGQALIPDGFGTAPLAAPAADFSRLPLVPALDLAEPAAEHLGDGEASYYGRELAGNRTASGERFNPLALTAAHRTLPLGSKLRVTNKANGRSVIVRINDRGPFVGRRIIDVSLGAARQIGMVQAGKALVRLELLS